MEFGAAIFFTDYSIGPVELGRALEERGFESLWAPEHSHIPLSRKTPSKSSRRILPRWDSGMEKCLRYQPASKGR